MTTSRKTGKISSVSGSMREVPYWKCRQRSSLEFESDCTVQAFRHAIVPTYSLPPRQPFMTMVDVSLLIG
jgi:hypothetical protein